MLGFKRRTVLPPQLLLPGGSLNPTSRSQTFFSISPLKKDYAVIPRVTFSFDSSLRGSFQETNSFIYILTAPVKLPKQFFNSLVIKFHGVFSSFTHTPAFSLERKFRTLSKRQLRPRQPIRTLPQLKGNLSRYLRTAMNRSRLGLISSHRAGPTVIISRASNRHVFNKQAGPSFAEFLLDNFTIYVLVGSLQGQPLPAAINLILKYIQSLFL